MKRIDIHPTIYYHGKWIIRAAPTGSSSWIFRHAMDGRVYVLRDIPKRRLPNAALALSRYTSENPTASSQWIKHRMAMP